MALSQDAKARLYDPLFTSNQALLLLCSKLFAQLRAISAQYATDLMWSIIALSCSMVEVVIGGGDRNRTDE
jgi:hypothetical protein